MTKPLPPHMMPTTSPEGKVLAPSLNSLFHALVLILKEKGIEIEADDLYGRAMTSDQNILDHVTGKS